MKIDLTGRRIVVTGAAHGIGRGAVEHYLESGASVVASDNEAMEGALPEAAQIPGRYLYVRCDVSRQSDVDACFAQAAEFLGGLDALCHPAGINGRVAAEDITEDDMRRMFDINVLGTTFTNLAAMRLMKQDGGSIINFTSSASIRGAKNEAHYAASKGAVAGWTRAVAHDWGRYNIRVNAIAPMTWTRLADVARNFLPEAERPAFDKRVHSMQLLPKGLRKADAIAPLLSFLASEGGDYITGQTFSIDGGVMLLGS